MSRPISSVVRVLLSVPAPTVAVTYKRPTIYLLADANVTFFVSDAGCRTWAGNLEGGCQRRSSLVPGIAPVTGIGKTPEFHQPEQDLEEEEEAMCLSWRQILRLLTRWDPLIQYTTGLHQIEAAMNDPPTAHKILAM